MKRRATIILAFLLISMLFPLNNFAQDVSQWNLPEGAIARLGKGSIVDIAYSPDGTHFAVASTIGIWLYDAYTYKAAALLTGYTSVSEIYAVVFSPDGKTLASASWDGSVRLWDVYTGQLRFTLTGYENNINDLVFSPDSKTLAMAHAEEILLWDTGTGQQHAVLSGHTGIIKAITFIPDSGRLVSASSDRTIRTWDVLTGQHKSVGGVKLNSYWDAVFSPDGKTLAIDHANSQRIELWETETGQFLRTFRTAGRVDAVAFSRDGRRLASSSGWPDYLIELWDTRTGEAFTIFTQHTWIIDALAFSPDGKTLISGSWNDTIKAWSVETGGSRVTLRGHLGWVGVVAFSPDGSTLASGSSNHAIQLWNMKSQQSYTTLEAHPFAFHVWGLTFSADGQLLVSGSTEEVLIWGARTGELHAKYQTWYGAIAFSPDGELFASGRFDGTIRLWDAHTIHDHAILQNRAILDAHRDSLNSLIFSPDGKTLASAGREGSIVLWDVSTAEVKIVMSGHEEPVTTLAFSPDGKTLASGGWDDRIRLWDTETNMLRHTLSGHTEGVTSVAFSPDSRTLASGGGDGTVRLWDVRTGENHTIFNGHNAYEVNSVAYSPDGRTFASGGGDGTVLLWKTQSEVPEDVNGDGRVNVDDLTFVAARFGHVGEGDAADVNADGVVNILDLVAVARAVE